MLLQTNSYIVPKERRAEHARLIRRFRQALARIGCDQFEVYEQVGANWSPGGANGRYVQIMRFRDRQHQQAVQVAEANDHGAQTIIAEFCDLINFPYQQEHGYFATGFYTSVLPTGPRQTTDYEGSETEEAPAEEGTPAADDPFIVGAAGQDAAAEISGDESLPAGGDSPAESYARVDEEQIADAPVSSIDGEKDLGEAESAALAEVAAMESGETGSSDALAASSQHGDFQTGVVAAQQYDQLQESDPITEASFAEPSAPAPAISQTTTDDVAATDDLAMASEVSPAPAEAAASDYAAPQQDNRYEDAPTAELTELTSGAFSIPQELPAEPEPVAAKYAVPTQSYEWDRRSDVTSTLSDQPLAEQQPVAAEVEPPAEEVEIDHGLLFDDELPSENLPPAYAGTHEEHAFSLDESATDFGSAAQVAASLGDHAAPYRPHEELLPSLPDSHLADRNPMRAGSTSDTDSGLDSLLDDANLLDNVPFPGALEEPPRLHSRRESAGGNGHPGPVDKDAELLEFESLIRQLEEDPSADHGRRAQ